MTLRKRKSQKNKRTTKPTKISKQKVDVTLQDHLIELRSRLLAVALFFLAATTVAYIFHNQVIAFIVQPLNQHLFFTSPLGAFEFSIQVSLLCGIIVTIPLATFQTLKFIEPLYLEKKQALNYPLILGLSLTMLVLGFLSAYYFFLPTSLKFLLAFGSDQLQSLITTKDYLTFFSFYLLAFCAISQLPLIFLLINSLRKLEIKALLKKQRLVIVISLIAAAIITPTGDLFNLLIVAVPLILLYQCSVFLVWLAQQNKIKLVCYS